MHNTALNLHHTHMTVVIKGWLAPAQPPVLKDHKLTQLQEFVLLIYKIYKIMETNKRLVVDLDRIIKY